MNFYYTFGGKAYRAFFIKGYRGHPTKGYTVCRWWLGEENRCREPLGEIIRHGPRDYQIEGSEEHYGSLNSAVERVVLG